MSADDEVAAAWIWKAERDLGAARALATGEFREAVVYHTQQSAEKAVKAFLASRRQRNRKTHDIPALLQLADELSPGFMEFSERGAALSDWAFRYRYPEAGERDLPNEDDVEQALDYAAAILAFVQTRIHLPEDAEQGGPSLHS